MIDIKGLSRSFGKNRVVDNLNLKINEGEVFGFLGPNGAGKTTTVRMLTCLIRPTEGTAVVDGLDIRNESDAMEIRKKVGLLTESPGLYDTLSAQRNLEFYAKLYDVPAAKRDERIEHYLKMMGLWEKRLEPVGGFSKGMKQKMAIARCLLHEPRVLFLDEPTSGLDPLVQQSFYALVREAQAEGRTVFLSSHILSEIERTCDRVAIIRDGRLVKVDSVEGLRDLAHHEVELRFVDGVPADAFEGLVGVSDLVVQDHTLRMRVSGPITPVVQAAARYELLDFVSREPTLEETFLAVYGRQTADAQHGHEAAEVARS
jgi:ABC-2 type transport system ATP-binding protein